MGERITASNLPGKHSSWLHLPGLDSMTVLCYEIWEHHNLFWDFMKEWRGVTLRGVTCRGAWRVVLDVLASSECRCEDSDSDMAPNPWNGDSGSICGICGELGIDSIAARHTHWEPWVTRVPAIREDWEVWRQFNDKKVNLFCHLSLFPLLLVNLLWLECDSSRP